MFGGHTGTERALSILRAASEVGPVALATSLSAEDFVLTDLIARHDLPIGLFALDTLMLHDETHAMIERVRSHYGLTIKVFQPAPDSVADLISRDGTYGFYESVKARKACCAVRKVVPLQEALTGLKAWVTGQRREQAASRAQVLEIEPDAPHGLTKFNPLAQWSWQDVLDYGALHNVPQSPLYARGYVSIGCAPCTRALKPGEDPRAARWWWEQDSSHKECGLHINTTNRETAL